MLVTPLGSEVKAKEVQLLKAPDSMLIRPLGSEVKAKDLHP